MRRGPTCRRLARERAKIAPAKRLKLDLIAQPVGEFERLGEGPFIDREQRRSEHGRIAAREWMLVVSGRKYQDVAVIGVFDGPREGGPARRRLQPRFRHTERKIDDLRAPIVD